jgi:hypothetical protein
MAARDGTAASRSAARLVRSERLQPQPLPRRR